MNDPATLVRHVEIDPPAALREAVRCLWHERREVGAAPVDFTILPDGYAEIVFHAGQIALAGDGAPLPSPSIVGLLEGPVTFRMQGRVDIVAARCFPWAVPDLLGIAPGRVAVRAIGAPLAALQPLLAVHLAADEPAQALAALAQHLLDARAGAIDGVLARAGHALRDANGTLPVSAVAATAHASVRTVERKFKRSAGLTVKDMAGLMRFEQVRNRLWLKPDMSIAALAQEFGYTDQAHLSREFKRYSGTTPGAFARKCRHALSR